MYKLIFATSDIEKNSEKYIYKFKKNILLNLYYVNNFYSKLMFRDVYKENEHLNEGYAIDIWAMSCSRYSGPTMLMDAQKIVFNRFQNREKFLVSIQSENDKIDLECWRVLIYQHDQDRVSFFPFADSDYLPIYAKNKPETSSE